MAYPAHLDLKVIGWEWFYLSTLLDDFSRCIIAWNLCTTMTAGDVTCALRKAIATAGCSQVCVPYNNPAIGNDPGDDGLLSALRRSEGRTE